jgi:hypothetical protein
MNVEPKLRWSVLLPIRTSSFTNQIRDVRASGRWAKRRERNHRSGRAARKTVTALIKKFAICWVRPG